MCDSDNLSDVFKVCFKLPIEQFLSNVFFVSRLSSLLIFRELVQEKFGISTEEKAGEGEDWRMNWE